MKITILTTIALFLVSQVFGQDIKIAYSDNMTLDLSGTTIEVVGDKNETEIYADFKVINEGAEPIEIKYQRKRVYNSGRMDQICDNELCYDADDQYSWTTPVINEISVGGSGIFKPQIVPNGLESCAIHSYYLVDELGVALDSITIIFKTTNAECNLSTEKNNEVSFNIFPNPTQDLVSFEGEALKNGGTVVFMDALGKEVKRASISSSNHQVNVSALKRGVYFVNIIDQSGSKSTVQRLIKQ